MKYGKAGQQPHGQSNPRSARSQRAFAEMMRQKKPDLAAVQRACDG